MAAKPRRLTVAITSDALAALDQIWDWSATHFGTDQAEQYVSFLRTEIANLAVTYAFGTPGAVTAEL